MAVKAGRWVFPQGLYINIFHLKKKEIREKGREVRKKMRKGGREEGGYCRENRKKKPNIEMRK